MLFRLPNATFKKRGETVRIVVQKFGGSSLATLEQRRRAFEKVREAVQSGVSPVVVVSAMGREGDPYATDTFLELLSATNPRPEAGNEDLLLSCGEIISAVIFAEGLRRAGLPAQALTGWQAGIFTDETHGKARVLGVSGGKIRELLKNGKIPVVAGFQGVSAGGAVTTLGRGGSDTTAAVLGAGLEAERLEIYSDVDGVKTADPRLVPQAPTLRVLSYRELVELAHSGAKILHPRAAEICLENELPIQVKSLFEGGAGTLISTSQAGASPIKDQVVTGITHLGKLASVRITAPDSRRGYSPSKIFGLLAQAQVSLDLIFLSPELIAFVIAEEKADLTKNVLTPLDLDVKIGIGFAKVAVVGAGMHGVPGVMSRVVTCLEREGIPIFQTTDSHANISCLIEEVHLSPAVQALYDEFRLDRT